MTLLPYTVAHARSCGVTKNAQPGQFPSMLPLLSSPLAYVFSSILDALWHQTTIALAPSCGMGTPHLARLTFRAGSHTRQPFLAAS